MSAPNYFQAMSKDVIGTYWDTTELINPIIQEHWPNIGAYVYPLVDDPSWVDYLSRVISFRFQAQIPEREELVQLMACYIGYATVLFGRDVVDQMWKRDPRTVACAMLSLVPLMGDVFMAGPRTKLAWLADVLTQISVALVRNTTETGSITLTEQLAVASTLSDSWIEQHCTNPKMARLLRMLTHAEYLDWTVQGPSAEIKKITVH